jgi:hypothetical protein
MRLLASVVVAMLVALVGIGSAQTDFALAALTVPETKLPDNCRLQPPPPQPHRVTQGNTIVVTAGPPVYFPFPGNPWVGTDRRLVVEARKRIDSFAVPDGPPPMLTERTRMEGAWVANVREGYHAAYVSSDVTVDVTAIRFDDASLVTTTRTVQGTHEPRDVSDRVTLRAVVVVLRANSKTDCFSAVDAYVRGLKSLDSR